MTKSSIRRILIPGASSGLGRALVLELVSPGVELILAGRQLAALDEAASDARDRGVAMLFPSS